MVKENWKKSVAQKLQCVPRSTLLNGLPLPNMMLSPTMEKASSGVHSANKSGTELSK